MRRVPVVPLRRATRAWVALTAGAACLGVLSGCTLPADGPPTAEASAGSSASRPTTPVTRGDLVEGRKIPGTLGYGTPVPVTSSGSGTVTGLPGFGDVIGLDGVLYSVDERPVRALHGSVPMWRTLERGLRGADVDQLKDSLRALAHDLADDDRFDRRTQVAVTAWQKQRGLEQTGRLTSSDVAFVPGDVRVDDLRGRVGDPAGEVVYGYTSTALVAVASVSPADLVRFQGGAAVDVGLADGTRVPGTVQSIGGDVDSGSGDEPGSGGGGQKATLVVHLDDPLPEGTSTTAPVDLLVDGESREDVLSVPVTALLATADGYAVEKAHADGSTTRVPVELGFFAQGRVEVIGDDLSDRDDVVVPS
ncbi:putative peptidoglycan binding protein [Frigoribacterium sp. PhB160]|uniref:peptidoglycan-binding protein n=1 Tax=Frigoribacterium sp. PhB160 TaxID=2485192 RepID=UPI000F4956DB|nr:peptidoglycan-binding protein [Frigoribacterium sp. PhB160]ROS57912.1 putative peptidoglycan binding protein [Frigoribacterium sp. PhB160]